MKQETFDLESHGYRIYTQIWSPKVPKGIVVLVHGMGEHIGRYTNTVIPMLYNTDMMVYAYDHIGHGQSEGKRGHCPSYAALLDVLEIAVSTASRRFPKLPVFLYGHSMGGNIVLNFVLRRKPVLSGIIVTSPYLRLAFKPPKWKMLLGKLFLKILPAITLASGLKASGISRDIAEVERYSNDPLVHDKISPMYSFPVMEAGEWVLSQAFQIKESILLLHGTGDPIIDFRATQEFAKRAPQSNLHLFDGGYHELHHDTCSSEMLQMVQNWLRGQL